ncbi:MAG: CBS domain-containing protein [Planctomycetota bacterium]|jgi:CBS-domain-containing membrane protein|nr:CBS domain-containing protein [Planctomycetota bacterium]
MAEVILARDLMISDFATIEDDRTLADAMRQLAAMHGDPDTPHALVVVDADGRFRSLLTAPLLFKGAARACGMEPGLLGSLLARSQMSLSEILILGLPVVGPADRLLSLIDACSEDRLEFVPVVEGGRAVGLVPATSIFQAVASLALTPEHEGIRLDRN